MPARLLVPGVGLLLLLLILSLVNRVGSAAGVNTLRVGTVGMALDLVRPVLSTLAALVVVDLVILVVGAGVVVLLVVLEIVVLVVETTDLLVVDVLEVVLVMLK